MAATGESTCLVNSCALTDSVVQRLENGAACHNKSVPRKTPPTPPPKPAAKPSPLQTANRGRVPVPSRPSPMARSNAGKDADTSANPHRHPKCTTTTGTCANHQHPPTDVSHSSSSAHSSLTSTDLPNKVANFKIKDTGVSKPSSGMASKTPSGDPPSGAVRAPTNDSGMASKTPSGDPHSGAVRAPTNDSGMASKTPSGDPHSGAVRVPTNDSGMASKTPSGDPHSGAVRAPTNDSGMASKTPSGDPPSGAVRAPTNDLSGGVKKPDLSRGSDCVKTADESVGGAVGGVRIEVSHEQNRYAACRSKSGGRGAGAGAGHVRRASDTSSRSGVGTPGSSSSSLSQASSNSFASRSLLLEHLKLELYQQRTASDPTLRGSGHQAEAEQDVDEIVQQLLEHIVSLKMELVSMREENDKLKQVRTTMDDELHTLTENLFEEAYKMVDSAKGGKVVAEKRLADAAGKIDAMETEMSALKNLLQAPPDKHSLNPHHHHKHKRPSVKKVIKRITKKAGVGRNSPTTTKHHRHRVTLLEHRSENKGAMLVEGEPVKDDYDAFSRWVEELKAGGTHDHAYLWGVVATDVRPCLAFRNKELSEQVLHAVEQNHLLMESLSSTAEENRECALSGSGNGLCTHRLQLGDSELGYQISQQARNRIVAACDFYMYISHIEKGILKLDTSQLYWQVSRLRALMSLARLNLSLPEDKPLQ